MDYFDGLVCRSACRAGLRYEIENHKIKIWILICFPYTFPTEVVGRKLIKYQANSSRLIMSVILMTTALFYKALILQGEIWCWTLLGLKGLINPKIKIWILICCPYSFPAEVVGRSWNSSCVIMSIILMTTLFYKALILQGEIWCWSLLGLKGLSVNDLQR